VDSLAKGQIDHAGASIPGGKLPEPEPITFQLNAAVEKAIAKAAERFDGDVRRHDHHALCTVPGPRHACGHFSSRRSRCRPDRPPPSITDYTGYGKNLIKKFKMSPDAYAQMAIQLAYYRLKGTVRATYESAQTRKFLAGRTEVRDAAI